MNALLRFVALAMLVVAGGAMAQRLQGAPQAGSTPSDPDFGVRSRHGLGLQRQVSMYQWRRDGQEYALAWADAPIDSTGFAPGHENPVSFPLQNQRWLAAPITFDGKPVAPEVVAALGQWQDFRPDFSALPGNLAVTFQPEGDGLGSAVNPLVPKPGDLRIGWRELVLPALAGKVELRGGRWQLAAGATPVMPAAEQQASDASTWPSWPWWLGLLALMIVAGGWWHRRSGR